MKKNQKKVFESGNELAAYAAKQINYHVMGYYPITPSTQIPQELDEMKSQGLHNISLIAAEGEHSAAGICYGASTCGARVFNATSANGLLYALEQFPVQSGTRFPMVMNVACRTVSGPLCIKGDHSDIMYMLNTGWIIMFASDPQEVYDFNICALKIAESVNLPVVIAYDGFFTSHQKRVCHIFSHDEDIRKFLGEYNAKYSALDLKNPVTIGSYMGENDIMNNKHQLHLAMEEARNTIPQVFNEYKDLSARYYNFTKEYKTYDAAVLLCILGSSFYTAKKAVDTLRAEGKKVGVFTLSFLRPFPKEEVSNLCRNAATVIIADRQDSYGGGGGNLSIEVKAALAEHKISCDVITRIYGLGGLDFYEKEAREIFLTAYEEKAKKFDYLNIHPGEATLSNKQYFNSLTKEECTLSCIKTQYNDEKKEITVNTGSINDTAQMPKRLAPGHGACPGCGIPVNINLLLRGINGNVVLLFQTGCAMVVTTSFPKTAFRVPYVHNLFQNGGATLSGITAAFKEKQRRKEIPSGEITFVMVSGDGGMDIGMGSALGAALRNENLIIFEYDNGGYMNTGYQLSYSTPKGAKSATSHVGKTQYGKTFFHKDTPQIMAAANIPYVATVAESNPQDFIKKAAKAAEYSKKYGTAYIKALSACPLNWGDKPDNERKTIDAAVNCCFFPLYEVENGITKISQNPEKANKKIPISEWLSMMGRTRHLTKEEYSSVLKEIQEETDRRWQRLLEKEKSTLL